jgi:hypothetical protein
MFPHFAHGRFARRAGKLTMRKGYQRRKLSMESLEQRCLLSATLSTDKASYAAGETALISGSGFQAGETIQLQVQQQGGSNSGTGQTPATVVDAGQSDAQGNFTAQWYVNPDTAAGSSFTVSAAGSSGDGAAANFQSTQAVNLAAGLPYLGSGPLTGSPGYTLSPASNYYNTSQGTGLTDGVTQPMVYEETSGAGWESPPLITIKFDLGQDEPLSAVKYHTCALDYWNSMMWVNDVYVLVSTDGVNYYPATELVHGASAPALTGTAGGWLPVPYQGPSMTLPVTLSATNLNTHGRYVKFIVDPAGYHFVDEIEIIKGSQSAPYTGIALPDSDLTQTRTVLGWRARIYDDMAQMQTQGASLGIDLTAPLAAIKQRVDTFTDPYHEFATFKTTYPTPPIAGTADSLGKIEYDLLKINSAILNAQGYSGTTLWTSNRWDTVNLYSSPSLGTPLSASSGFSLEMMNGESRSQVLNITNTNSVDATVTLNVTGLAGGNNPAWAQLSLVQDTDNGTHQLMSDMLVPLTAGPGGYTITVPAGMTQQLWIKFSPSALPVGDTKGNILVSDGTLSTSVPVTLSISPYTFPQTLSLSMGMWDSLDALMIPGADAGIPSQVTTANMNAVANVLQQYKIDTYWSSAAFLGSWNIDQRAFDANNRFIGSKDVWGYGVDYFQHFDQWIARFPNMPVYYIFASVDPAGNFAGTNMYTNPALFTARVQGWMNALEDHMHALGMDPSRLAMLLLDEPGSLQEQTTIVNWAQAIENRPLRYGSRIQVYEDMTLRQLPAYSINGTDIYGVSDIISPSVGELLKYEQIGLSYADHSLAFYQAQKAAGKTLAFYAAPDHLDDPYTFDLLNNWIEAKYGGSSMAYWSVLATGGTTFNEYINSTDYSRLYFDGTSVYASKHMEAILEGREDYQYIQTLRSLIDALRTRDPNNALIGEATNVLNNAIATVTAQLEHPGNDYPSLVRSTTPKDRSVADTQRNALWTEINAITALLPDVPNAVNDTAQVGEGYSVIHNVLANDSDPYGRTIAALKVTDPAHGTVSLRSDGTYTYTPNADYVGPDSFTYKINNGLADSNVATVTITVIDMPLTIGNVTTPAATEGTAVTGTFAHFTDLNPLATAADFTATITWADGTTSPGSVQASTSGGFDVTGSHTYSDMVSGGTLSVMVSDPGGSTASASVANVTVADAPLTITKLTPPQATEGIAVAGTMAHFTDANPLAPAADFVATINWADGSSSAGTVQAGTNGGFDITGNHTYSDTLSGGTVSVTVRDVSGSTTVSASVGSVSVADFVPTVFSLGNAAVTLYQGTSLTQSGTLSDNAADSPWQVYANYNYDAVTNPGLGTLLQSGPGTTFTLSNVYNTPGSYIARVTVVNRDGVSAASSLAVTVLPTFRVTAFTPNISGFDATFNRADDLSKLSLYRGQSNGGVPDVTVVGRRTGAIQGSLVWDTTTNTATFVATGGALAADTYTVTLVSAGTGWVDGSGHLLDGDANGLDGGNYVTTFKVTSSSTPLLTLPNFARGPNQTVKTDFNGTSSGSGLPIRINDGSGLTKISFELDYNPSLLHVTGATLASNMPTNWSVTTRFVAVDSAHAQVFVTASGGTALSSGARNVVLLTADVPKAAPYAAAEVLRLKSVTLNGSTSARGDLAVHKVAYFGDADGSGNYSSMDTSLISRVAAHTDTGFDAYLLTDPLIVGDINGDGSITSGGSSSDASLMSQEVTGTAVKQIPTLPKPAVTLITGGVDPVVSLPVGVVAQPGDIVRVPLSIAGPAEAGLQSFDLQFTFDTRLLYLSPSDVKLAGLTATHWQLLVSVDAVRGVIDVSAFGLAPLAQNVGTILSIDFHVRNGISSGTSVISVAAGAGGGLNGGALQLTPVDGSITVATAAIAPQKSANRTAAAHDLVLAQMALDLQEAASQPYLLPWLDQADWLWKKPANVLIR